MMGVHGEAVMDCEGSWNRTSLQQKRAFSAETFPEAVLAMMGVLGLALALHQVRRHDERLGTYNILYLVPLTLNDVGRPSIGTRRGAHTGSTLARRRACGRNQTVRAQHIL